MKIVLFIAVLTVMGWSPSVEAQEPIKALGPAVVMVDPNLFFDGNVGRLIVAGIEEGLVLAGADLRRPPQYRYSPEIALPGIKRIFLVRDAQRWGTANALGALAWGPVVVAATGEFVRVRLSMQIIEPLPGELPRIGHAATAEGSSFGLSNVLIFSNYAVLGLSVQEARLKQAIVGATLNVLEKLKLYTPPSPPPSVPQESSPVREGSRPAPFLAEQAFNFISPRA